jgi:hypothetical protein
LPTDNNDDEDDEYTEALKSLGNENLEKDVEQLDNEQIINDLFNNENDLENKQITEVRMRRAMRMKRILM